MKICVVIPVYNHEQVIGRIVNDVLAQNLDCILVDDGSQPKAAQVLDKIAAAAPARIRLLRHKINSGKGSAVLTGFTAAIQAGYTHVLQIDADGQHNTADIPKFIAAANLHPEAVITGYPEYDESVPKSRLYGRYITHLWVWINTLSFAIKDSMCGFRIYPLTVVNDLMQKSNISKRMDFDIEILVRLHWENVHIINIPTQVRYPEDGISHFRLWWDNFLISRMHALLFFGMLWRIPKLLLHKLQKKHSSKHWANINEVTFIAGMRFLFWTYCYLGRWPFRILLYPVVFIYVLTQRTAYKASKKYLHHIIKLNPKAGIKDNLFGVMRHFSAFSENILDKMRIWSKNTDLLAAQYFGHEPILNYISKKRGGILICSHYGNLDLCRVFAKNRPGFKLTILMHTKHATKFNRLLEELDPSIMLNIMEVTEVTPASALALKAKISQGEWIAIAGDRVPVNHNSRTTCASFLGQEALFPIGPYILAHLLQCPVYLLFAMPTNRGIELHFEFFQESIQLPRQQREQLFSELAAAYASRLEYFCLKEPLQWFNFYDFWNSSNYKTNIPTNLLSVHNEKN